MHANQETPTFLDLEINTIKWVVVIKLVSVRMGNCPYEKGGRDAGGAKETLVAASCSPSTILSERVVVEHEEERIVALGRNHEAVVLMLEFMMVGKDSQLSVIRIELE